MERPDSSSCSLGPENRVLWSGFGRSRFGRLFAFLGPRQSRDSCRSRGLALLEKFVRSRHKPTWSRPPGKFAALPWCCRSVTPSGGSTRVSLVFHFQKIMAFGKRAALQQPAGMPDKNSKKIAFWRILSAKCIWHLCLVPRLPSSGANIGSGARSGAGAPANSTTRRRRVVWNFRS